ncbi:histidinol-phosphate transaminase [Gangjinia marincola]
MKKDFNIESLVRDNVARMKPYSSARDEFKAVGEGMIFLDANENPFDNGVNRYPDPQQRTLKSVLARQKGVQPNQLLIGNGSDEVLDLLFRAFCEPGRDNIIFQPPTYGMYKVLAETNAVAYKEVLLDEEFQPQMAELKNTIDDCTKMVFFCSPNNPSGNTFDADKIEVILQDFSGLVVIDEAYIDFSEENSWINRLDEFPNLVITQTLSKAYGMAGIRIGLSYASAEIISILNKIKPPYNVNQLSQQRALERVENVEEVAYEVALLKAQREELYEAFTEIDFIEKMHESDANFILVKVDDALKRYNQLLEQGIVARNRSNQPRCENTLRFTVGTKEENKQLIKVLQKL